jgi:phosphohistidine phosphatase SixA
VARGLRGLGVLPAKIVVSPYRRSRETGEVAAEVLGLGEEAFVTTDTLLPQAEPHALIERLPYFGDEDLLLVGHAPHIDLFLASLLGIERNILTAMKKAGAALLELDGPEALPARLVWLMEPRALRRL